jgi:ATP-dependent Lon protease
MRDFRDAKAMARTLRDLLTAKSVSLTHTDSLELVARMLGLHDWNELSAKIQSESEGAVASPGPLIPASTAPFVARADLPVVPLRDIVLFPEMIVPVLVGRDASRRALERAMSEDRRILVVTQRRAEDDRPAPSALYGVGTVSVIDVLNRHDRGLTVLAKCLKRAAIMQWAEGPFLAAAIAPIEETRGKDEEAVALSRTVIEKLRAMKGFPFQYSEGYDLWTGPPEEPGDLADAVAARLSGTIEQKQEILEAADVITRLQKILTLIQTGKQAA